MKIMSDGEAFGLKFACFLLLICVIVLLFLKPVEKDPMFPEPIYDTIIVTQTDTVYDTIVKWKRIEVKEQISVIDTN